MPGSLPPPLIPTPDLLTILARTALTAVKPPCVLLTYQSFFPVAAHRFHTGTKENEKANGAKGTHPAGRVTSLGICRGQLRSAPSFDLPLPRKGSNIPLRPSPSPKTRSSNPMNANMRKSERGRIWFDHERLHACVSAQGRERWGS